MYKLIHTERQRETKTDTQSMPQNGINTTKWYFRKGVFGLRPGSGIKSACCYCREIRFSSQTPHGG